MLDEPFSGLDPVGVDVLSGALSEEAQRGAAVVFSSHQLELVEQLCDAVTILDKGTVVASGGIEELRRPARGPAPAGGRPGDGADWAEGLASVTAVLPTA